MCAGVHASSALCSAMPAGLALDACTAGRISVRGHVPDLHEPTISCLGAHEEVRAACCRGLAAGAALPCHAKRAGINVWLQAQDISDAFMTFIPTCMTKSACRGMPQQHYVVPTPAVVLRG
jgi:hypothetical protein